MAAPMTTSTGEIVKPQRNGAAAHGTLISTIQTLGAELARAIPRSVLAPDRFARLAITAVRTNSKLAQCEPASFLSALFAAAQLGLEPNTPLGHAYLIPRANRKRGVMECTFQLGYQGMRELAFRTGAITALYARPVHRGDRFVFLLGDEERIEHEPLGEDRVDPKSLTHVYAIAKVKGGDPVREVLTRAQVESRRQRSSYRDDGPWVSDYIAMSRKTAIRALWPSLPRSTEMAIAQQAEALSDAGRSIGAALLDTPAGDALAKIGAMEIDESAAIDPETGEVLSPDAVVME